MGIRDSIDVPAHLFTPRTTFSLNNRSYESILAGSPERGGGPAINDDPLIRLLARGVAGYRAAAKAVHHALQGPIITVESLSDPDASGVFEASVRVKGQFRDSGDPFTGRASLRLVCTEGELMSIDVICAEEDLARETPGKWVSNTRSGGTGL